MGTGTGTAAVYDREWDGSSWTAIPANPVFGNIQNSNEHSEAWGFGFDLNLETMAAYRFFNNANSYDVGSALTAQDTPYTFSAANPDFRLRILLFYTDTLALNSRTYNLQFIDPGHGTCSAPGVDGSPNAWTTVGTGVSTLIAFKDNATPADNNALTANAADPTYGGGTYTMRNQTYEESNTFTDSQVAIGANEIGKWDFSLHDNTVYDRTAQTFCFRVVRSNGTLIRSPDYPQITTAGISDVLIQGHSLIRQGTKIQ
jgi:hypothetical protein